MANIIFQIIGNLKRVGSDRIPIMIMGWNSEDGKRKGNTEKLWTHGVRKA